MNLVSCENCGTVIDTNRIECPEIWDDNGEIIRGKAEWDGDRFVPVFDCPVCKKPVQFPWR